MENTSSLNDITKVPNIRDRLPKEWYWSDKEFIENYAALVGINAVGVYIVLCERAYNDTQRAEVSGGLIAEILGISRTSVTEALFALEVHTIIDIEEQRDAETRQQLPSLYTLLSKDLWTKEPPPERLESVKNRRDESKRQRLEKKPKPVRTTRKTVGAKPLDEKKSKSRGYAATRHRVTSGRHRVSNEAAYPMPCGEGMVPPDGIAIKHIEDQEEIKKTTTIACGAEALPVVDENQNFLSQAEAQNSPISAETEKQPPLPGTAVTQVAKKPSLGIEDLARCLVAFAETNGRSIDEEIAARVLLSSEWGRKVAKLSDQALSRLIGPEHAEAGLSEAIGGEAKAKLLADVPVLRWRLFVWPQQRPGVISYYERKGTKADLSGSFIRHWREEKEPPIEWLDALVAEDRRRREAELRLARETAADEVSATLTRAQLNRVKAEVSDRLRAQPSVTGNWNEEDLRQRSTRIEVLNDAEFVATLAGFVDEAPRASEPEKPLAAVPDTALPPWKQDVSIENYEPLPAVKARMIQPSRLLLRRLRAGEIKREQILDRVLERPGFDRQELTWLAAQIEAEWDAMEQSKAA